MGGAPLYTSRQRAGRRQTSFVIKDISLIFLFVLFERVCSGVLSRVGAAETWLLSSRLLVDMIDILHVFLSVSIERVCQVSVG